MKKNKETKSLLTDEDMKTENIKANITIRMSGELLNAYRVEAAKLGIGYQTLMQMKLKEGLDHSVEKRLEKLENAMKAIQDSTDVYNKRVVEEMDKQILAFGKEHEYKFILPLSTTLYADSASNITHEVIEYINK